MVKKPQAGPAPIAPALRSHPIDPNKALMVAGACWFGFAAMVVAVQQGATVRFDAFFLQMFRTGPDLRPAGPPWLLEAVRDYTGLGGVLLRHIFAIFALVALLFLRLRREALVLAATIVGGWVINSVIKLLVGRPRPTIVPHLTEAGGASFPSGHSFNSAVVFIAIALAFAAMTRRESARVVIVLVAVLMTMLVAASRVWLGVHFPSDVVAGWLGGAAWALTATAILDRPARQAAIQAAPALEAITPGAEPAGTAAARPGPGRSR